MNATIVRFGYPQTLITECKHWVVLLRPTQPTLGSLILAAKGEAQRLSELKSESFEELPGIVSSIETTLTQVVHYQKINYLMLMMVDPRVHFHVIPRYDGKREARGIAVEDAGWPGLPALDQAFQLDHLQTAGLVDCLSDAWPNF